MQSVSIKRLTSGYSASTSRQQHFVLNEAWSQHPSATRKRNQKHRKHEKTIEKNRIIENTKTHKFDWSRADSRQKTPVLQLHSEGDERRTFGRAAPRSTCQHCKDGFTEFTVDDYSAILIFLYQCCECSVNHLASFGANQLHPFQVHCVWRLI